MASIPPSSVDAAGGAGRESSPLIGRATGTLQTMLLAELEVWHTRPRTPTRRLSLGNLVLPADPAPGFGGLLLGAVLAGHIGDVGAELVPDVHRLIDQIDRGDRVVQPRLRHRFQVDRHGLAVSSHRLMGVGEQISFDFKTTGTGMAQVLGAIYALERLAPQTRRVIAPVLHKAIGWHGPIGPTLIAHLAGATATTLAALADPRAWALEVLGFPLGSATPTRKEVTMRFRARMREVHPDHGGDRTVASTHIVELAEARKILTATSGAS